MSRWRHRRYDDLQKRAAVDHFFDHGQRLARTVRQPGYPKSKELLASWVDELEPGGVCPVTLVDRASRLLVGGRSARQSCPEVGDDLVAALSGRPLKTVTPDQGKKRAGNAEVSGRLGGVQLLLPGTPPLEQGHQREHQRATAGVLPERDGLLEGQPRRGRAGPRPHQRQALEGARYKTVNEVHRKTLHSA